MKKIILTIITATILILSLNVSAFAVTADELLPRLGEDQKNGENTAIIDTYPETEIVGNLPELTLESTITTAILTVLKWSMLLAIAAIIAAAFYYITSRGKEEDITKAKDIIFYLLIGMAIIAGAYGIVAGIAQFDFFD